MIAQGDCKVSPIKQLAVAAQRSLRFATDARRAINENQFPRSREIASSLDLEKHIVKRYT